MTPPLAATVASAASPAPVATRLKADEIPPPVLRSPMGEIVASGAPLIGSARTSLLMGIARAHTATMFDRDGCRGMQVASNRVLDLFDAVWSATDDEPHGADLRAA
jgi:hypothetical protein